MTQELTGTSVFLVEDETLIALLIEDMIEDLGGELAGTATSIAQALALLDRAHPDIAVLDVNIAGEVVFPVCERLAERGIPFVFSTGYGEPGVPEQWRECAVLQKPYDTDQLGAALTHCLDRKAH